MIKNSNQNTKEPDLTEIIADMNKFILQLKKDIIRDPLNNREKINQLRDSIKFINSIFREIIR